MPENEKRTAIEAPDKVAKPVAARSSADGRIDRIVEETKHLSDDLMDWVNLRLRLAQLDIQDRIDNELDFVFSAILVLVTIMVALLMASIGLAFVLGEWLGEVWHGFAIMTVVYLIAALVISRVRPRLGAGFRSTWAQERRDRVDDAGKSDK